MISLCLARKRDVFQLLRAVGPAFTVLAGLTVDYPGRMSCFVIEMLYLNRKNGTSANVKCKDVPLVGNTHNPSYKKVISAHITVFLYSMSRTPWLVFRTRNLRQRNGTKIDFVSLPVPVISHKRDILAFYISRCPVLPLQIEHLDYETGHPAWIIHSLSRQS